MCDQEFTDEQIRAQFDLMDTNKNGTIEKGEVKKFLINLGVESTECDGIVEELLKDADANKDGKITYAEFRKVLK